MFYKKAVLKTFADFTEKGLCRSFKQRVEKAKYVILVFTLDLVHVASEARLLLTLQTRTDILNFYGDFEK